MTARQAGTFMRAFGNGTRLRIIAALFDRPLSVADMTQLLGCPKKRLSRHLQYLHARGIVWFDQRGKFMVYHLAAPVGALHAGAISTLEVCLDGIDEVRADTEKVRRRGK